MTRASPKGNARPCCSAEWPLVWKVDHDLVRTHETEIPADQLIGHVGIGFPWIQKCGAMPQLRALNLQPGELKPPLLKIMAIPAPGKKTIRSGDGVTSEIADNQQRQRGQGRATNDSQAAGAPVHASKESESPA